MALFRRSTSSEKGDPVEVLAKEEPLPKWNPDQLWEKQNQCVRKSAERTVESHWGNCVTRYLKDHRNILDADRAKELFPIYAKNFESRARWSSAVYGPASSFIDRHYESLLAIDGSERPSNLVLFLSGGPGSGKTTFIVNNPAVIANAYLVMDGTLSDTDRAIENIDQALIEDFEILTIFVYRPFEEAVRGVIRRGLSLTSGRVVPLSTVAAKHFGAARSMVNLEAAYNEVKTVEFDYFRYMGMNRPFSSVDIGTALADLQNIDNLEDRAYAVLEEEYEIGRYISPTEAHKAGEQQFSKAIYKAFNR